MTSIPGPDWCSMTLTGAMIAVPSHQDPVALYSSIKQKRKHKERRGRSRRDSGILKSAWVILVLNFRLQQHSPEYTARQLGSANHFQLFESGAVIDCPILQLSKHQNLNVKDPNSRNKSNPSLFPARQSSTIVPPTRQCLLEKQKVRAVREEDSKLESLNQPHFQAIPKHTYLVDSNTCQRPDGVPNLQRSIPTIREKTRQAKGLKRALRFTSGVLVEAGAATVIHNYRPLRERADLDVWYRSHPQQTSASDIKNVAGLLLEQALRLWSNPVKRGQLLSKTVRHLAYFSGVSSDDVLTSFGASFTRLSQKELVRDPGPGTFVSSCAVLILCLVHLMQHTSHHPYQNTFISCGTICGVLIGVLTARHETILVDALTTYLPSTIIVAQILSVLLHSFCSTWRDPETCEQASTY